MQYNFDQIVDRHNTNCVKWDEIKHPDMLPLWVADMDFATAPCVQEAVVRRATHGCYGYTLVPDSYYEAIQEWYAVRHQWNIPTGSILYTIGVIPAIAAILKAVCQTGDNVVMLTPVYNCFYNLIRNAGCQLVSVPLVGNANPNLLRPKDARTEGSNLDLLTYSIDWEALEEALSMEKSTVLLLSNPHNPTGRIWTEEELHRMGELCQRHHITLISDEIHNELSLPDRMYVPFGRIVDAELENLSWAMCGSPSKSFNIAGLQNAYIVCPDSELRRRVDRAINLNETCDVNPFGVVALEAAYREGAEWLDSLRSYICGNYRYALERLSVVPELKVADLQATYLIWVDCRTICNRLGISSVELANRLRVDAHVWFCAGSIYGTEGEGFLRVNLACPRATLEEALTRFIAYVQ